jgi:homoserine dehydrogenase
MIGDIAFAPARVRPLRVAIAGFGVVGSAVAKILCERQELGRAIHLTHVFNRDVARKRVPWVPDTVAWTDRIEDLFASEIDVLVEVVGGVDQAYAWVSAALDRGISVVTANKLLIARHGRALIDLAAARGAELRFEAAVAGGVPVIDAIERGIAGDRLARVSGILNGTCNFILSRLASARGSFDEAVARARELGLAEADPSSDLDGIDAAAKLAVLAGVAFDLELPIEDVSRQSIAAITPIDFDYAARLGCTIRQVAVAERHGDSGLVASVGPALVGLESPLARVEGAGNIVLVSGAYGGDVTLAGRGAGGDPTAVAVISDLLSLSRGERRARRGGWRSARVVSSAPVARYVRFVVRDRPGILAAFAGVFARHGINVDAVLQEPGHPKARLPFVMTLEPCGEEEMTSALEELSLVDVHESRPLAAPILRGGNDVPR